MAPEALAERVLLFPGDNVAETSIATRNGDGSFNGPGLILPLGNSGSMVHFKGTPSVNDPMELTATLDLGAH